MTSLNSKLHEVECINSASTIHIRHQRLSLSTFMSAIFQASIILQKMVRACFHQLDFVLPPQRFYYSIVYFFNPPCFCSLLLHCNAEHLDPINVKIAELREALESVTSEQKYLKARDARHRHSKLL